MSKFLKLKKSEDRLSNGRTSRLSMSSSDDSLQNLLLTKNESVTVEGGSLEKLRQASDRPKSRWFSQGIGNNRVTQSPPPMYSIPRHSRPRQMGLLKGMVMSMIDQIECVGLTVKQVSVPKPKPKSEPGWVDLSNGRPYSDIYPHLRLAKSPLYRQISPGLPPSNSSSIIDFDKVVFDDVPRTPRTPPFPKVFGFDRYGNEVAEDDLPEIQYAFAIKQQARNNVQVLEEYLDLFGDYDRLPDAGGISESEILNQSRASNPNLPKEKLETVEAYMNQISSEKHQRECLENQRNSKKKTLFNTGGDEKATRTRRKLQSGSYKTKSVDENKLPTLMRYVWKGKLAKVKKYLKDIHKHRKINRTDYQGRTALHFAASWGCSKTIKELLKIPEIDINARDEEYKTPLFKAVEIGDLASVQFLLKAKASISIRAADGRDVFNYALQELGDNHYDMIKYLYDVGEMKCLRKSDGQVTFLHLLCLAKKHIKVSKVMKFLIKEGEHVNATEGAGRTPLMLAISNNRPELVKILLESNADIQHIDMYLKSAIQLARPNTECYKLLQKFMKQQDRMNQRMKINRKTTTTTTTTVVTSSSTNNSTVLTSPPAGKRKIIMVQPAPTQL